MGKRLLGMGIIALAVYSMSQQAFAAGAMVRLTGHVRPNQLKGATDLGRTSSGAIFKLSVPLRLPDESGLAEFIQRVHDPADPLYGRFLSTSEFASRFGVSAADYAAVSGYFTGLGLKVTKTHPNRLLLELEGSATQVESALAVEMHNYTNAKQMRFHAPSSEPLVPAHIAEKIHGIMGLNSFSRVKPLLTPGNGPVVGGLTPADIRKAYQFDQIPLDGKGQTLALVEYDGYLASDVAAYVKTFNITNPAPLQNILVDGFSGTPASAKGQGECTLDIEMVLAVAPHLDKILVYEGPPGSSYMNVLTKIANDNLAKQVSMSWGTPEDKSDPNGIQAENTIFMQMAAQGQTVFIASGDSGAYAGQTANRVVANPGGQVYITSVGGTKMTINADGSYGSESSWGYLPNNAGGGGGISGILPMPSFQAGLASTANLGSTTHRMIPDVSLNASGQTGFYYYLRGNGLTGGGTSFAAPIWAAFGALINQRRAANNLPALGYLTPKIYQIAQSSLYASTFHDVKDGTTNLYYPATPGYDLSTGWGSPIGPALLNALSTSLLPPAAPGTFKATLITPIQVGRVANEH